MFVWTDLIRRVLSPKFLTAATLTAVLLAGCVARTRVIRAGLPYPQHVDETALTGPASRMLKTGNFNPHFFDYPTLPIYMTAAAFTAGFVSAASHLELRTTADLRSFNFPYYTHPRIVLFAKLLFAALSVLTLAIVSCLAFRIRRSLLLIPLVPLILSLSPMFFFQSARYLNVDIVGCFFAAAALLYAVHVLEQPPSFHNRAILPGILGGLTIACKYNLITVLAPLILGIVLGGGSWRSKLKQVLLLNVTAGLTFLTAVPYSFLDFSGFLSGIGRVVYNYQTGHGGFSGTPGFPQLFFYIKYLVGEYGFLAFSIGMLGMIYGFISDWKRTFMVLSLPALLLVLMSMQVTNFPRNVLVADMLLPVFVGVGISGFASMAGKASRRIGYGSLERLWVCVALACFAATVPRSRVLDAYNVGPDSRILAQSWITENIPKGCSILVPEEAQMDTRGLNKDYKIVSVSLLQEDPIEPYDYVLDPVFTHDSRRQTGKWKTSTKDANAHFDGLKALKEFGANPVIGHSPVLNPFGNPKFTIRAGRAQATTP